MPIQWPTKKIGVFNCTLLYHRDTRHSAHTNIKMADQEVPKDLWPHSTPAPKLQDVLAQISTFLGGLRYSKTVASLEKDAVKKGLPKPTDSDNGISLMQNYQIGSNNVSGQTKRAVAGGMQISIGNCGAIIGTQLYRTQTAPRYKLGHSFALAYLVLNIVVVTTLWFLLKKENARKDAALGVVKSEISETHKVDKAPSESSSEERRGSVGMRGIDNFQGDDDLRWRFMI